MVALMLTNPTVILHFRYEEHPPLASMAASRKQPLRGLQSSVIALRCPLEPAMPSPFRAGSRYPRYGGSPGSRRCGPPAPSCACRTDDETALTGLPERLLQQPDYTPWVQVLPGCGDASAGDGYDCRHQGKHGSAGHTPPWSFALQPGGQSRARLLPRAFSAGGRLTSGHRCPVAARRTLAVARGGRCRQGYGCNRATGRDVSRCGPGRRSR